MSKLADKLMAELIADYFEKHLKRIEEMVASAVGRILKSKTSDFERMVRELAKPGKDADEDKILIALLEQIASRLPREANILAELVKKIPAPLSGSPDTGEVIVEKINALPTDDPEKRIDVSHIKNIKELIERLYPSGTLGGAIRGGMETVKSEKLTPTASGANITLDLTTLSTSWSRLIGVYRQGQKLTPDSTSGYARSSNTLTVYNATTDEDFLVDYAS